uniref:GOLD domain-containing protein n=1 Tax=Palpitomonas bilix TaxID=652834 RepID=A0A7S3GH27_9EUKA|mmetsp:Transcript_4923/g.10462  ORF Transcript_4923/g.10462 Transcript_4923/m.10462 type:complete len:436 (+) Transcript_4923:17-1324(+)|eukprot:CAMPEP_0113871626 /NCGR_PEP_ID=MMETSP0780_2-20120614/2751_1 /TAXON_ID=652834 /ORGANISM="Palpitomonas bilix" /LENGTH=435 /DNA_ID=CAMNT_0000857045 /DNA_START=17 /DNA_END=1324 /DNA_ORIENTATION=+ /assembly_acc=CAM_ASM_000599
MGKAKDAGLVPITREYFKQLYKDTEIPTFSDEYNSTIKAITERIEAFKAAGHTIDASNRLEVPEKMEETMYKMRHLFETCAELFFPAEKSPYPPAVRNHAAMKAELKSSSEGLLKEGRETSIKAAAIVDTYQTNNADRVKGIVRGFLPKDFRAQLFMNHQERSDRKKKAAIEKLMAKGGTLVDKYTKLWDDQMERRKKLAQIGGATGIFAAIVKLLAGIPQVLLDFVKQINDKEGPMEEIRAKFGPPLYSLLEGGNEVVTHLATLTHADNSSKFSVDELSADIKLSVTAINEMTRMVDMYMQFCAGTIGKAPFFVKAEELSQEGGAGDNTEAINVSARSKEVISVDVEDGDAVDYELSLDAKDIDFSVTLTAGGNTIALLPKKRCESSKGPLKGSITAPQEGVLTFVFDNSFSLLTSKSLRFKAVNTTSEAKDKQ